MEDQKSQALAALEAARQKGLSYYDAVQSLKTQGFDQEVIDDVTMTYNAQQDEAKEEKGEVTERQKMRDQMDRIKAEEKQDKLENEIDNFRW